MKKFSRSMYRAALTNATDKCRRDSEIVIMPKQIVRKMLGENVQPPASISANTIFLACNFVNKRIKRHFDGLKKKWENILPVRVYLSDKVQGGGARDLWDDITQTITEANLAIFDVTSFRPNVILELGFSLARKSANQIIICRDLTPSGKTNRKQETWQLSDIPHLYRIEYRNFIMLDEQLLQHVERMAPVRNFYNLTREIERQRRLSHRLYIAEALAALKELRDQGPILRKKFSFRFKSHGVDAEALEDLLIRFELAKPESGRDGLWKLID